jgi:hypothetical protein
MIAVFIIFYFLLSFLNNRISKKDIAIQNRLISNIKNEKELKRLLNDHDITTG